MGTVLNYNPNSWNVSFSKKIILVFILFKFKKRPNISKIRVV